MKFTKTIFDGVWIIEFEPKYDERGFFSRVWCSKEFESRGLSNNLSQINRSFNHNKGTLRGMHYQLPPHEEVKLVWCVKGAIYDVIIDLRKDSKTFKNFLSLELNEKNYTMLYIPKAFAHGYLTLEDNTEVIYFTSEPYYPEFSREIRWNDPAFNINWPYENPTISDKDRSCSDFNESSSLFY